MNYNLDTKPNWCNVILDKYTEYSFKFKNIVKIEFTDVH